MKAEHHVLGHRELTEVLIREMGIHNGHWGIYVEFGVYGVNFQARESEAYDPAAVVPVKQIGIQRYEKSNDMTVDAAKVNPLKRRKK